MYIIPDSIKNHVYSAYAEPTREFRHRISFGEWHATDTGREFISDTSQEIGIIKLDIYQSTNNSGSGLVMGCCCSSFCEAEFYNLKKSYNYSGKIMFVECGIKVPEYSEDFFYIPCGYYKIDKPETDDDGRTLQVKGAYDDIDGMKKQFSSSLTFPTSADAVLCELAGKYHITVESNSYFDLLKTHQITAAQALTLTSYTEREVLGFLAGIVGANAFINTQGNLKISWYVEQEEIAVPSKLQWQNSFRKTSESPFTVNSITSGIEDNVFTSGTGEGITFANPIISESDIAAIYQMYSGRSFQPCTCEWRGNPCIECGDAFTATDKNGASYTVFVAEQHIDLTGGLSMTVTCPGGDADISFDTVDKSTRAALNKQKSDLQTAIEESTKALNGARGGYFKILDSDEDGNPDGWLITETEDGSTGKMLANKAGLGLSEDGGKTYRTAITYKGINADCINSGKISTSLLEFDSEEWSGLIISGTQITGLDKNSDFIRIIKILDENDEIVHSWIEGWEEDEDGNEFIAINGGTIAANTVLARQIAANQITAEHITSKAITSEHIAAGAITADHIAAGAITLGTAKAGCYTYLEGGKLKFYDRALSDESQEIGYICGQTAASGIDFIEISGTDAIYLAGNLAQIQIGNTNNGNSTVNIIADALTFNGSPIGSNEFVFDCGYVSGTGGRVTFNKSFSSAPFIFTQVHSNFSNNSSDIGLVMVLRTVSSTSFTAYFGLNDGGFETAETSYMKGFYWFAIGT